MRLTFPNFGPAVLDDLHATLAGLGISGFTGVTRDAAGLHVEFPGRKTMTSDQRTAINEAIAAYVYTPPAEG